MQKVLLIVFVLCLTFWGVGCKKQDYRMNGTYMPYTFENHKYTEPPQGYSPFYINYVGRHGSRYPLSDDDLILIINQLTDAEKKSSITNKGKDLLITLTEIKKACLNKWGNLSNVGIKQLKGIAHRILSNYPDIFQEHIYMQSDNSERCQESMKVFLSEFNTKVDKKQIQVEILPDNNPVLEFFKINLAYNEYRNNGIWKKEYKKYVDSSFQMNRPIRSLFEVEYSDTLQHKVKLLHALYRIYAILPDTDINSSLEKYFTGDEIYSLWDIQNVREYLEKGPSPLSDGLQTNICFTLMEDFLETSNSAISEAGTSGDFRFTHAEAIIPFAAFLEIPIASANVTDLNLISQSWLDFQIAPMAANIQWIFYSNDKGEFLVKMLLNEKEVPFPVESDLAPYYRWDAVRDYYQQKLDKLPTIKSFSMEKKIKYFKE